MKKVYGPRESTTIKGVDKAAGSNAGPKHVTDLDVEISGWDVLQFLKLVRSGDATVMEMLLCPMTYINDKALMAEVRVCSDETELAGSPKSRPHEGLLRCAPIQNTTHLQLSTMAKPAFGSPDGRWS
eukprot:2719307-Rhodomonas_salina.2